MNYKRETIGMGYVVHKTMCITSWNKEVLLECRDHIESLGLDVSEIKMARVDHYHTFFVYPSGAKNGWPEAQAHSDKIKASIEIIKSYDCEDGSNPIEYCVPAYGEAFTF